MNQALPDRRKRSARVALTTMAVLSGSALVAGCGDGQAMPAANAAQTAIKGPDAEEVQVFENIFECAKETGQTREQCSDQREQALAVADETSPRFSAVEDCEEEFGAGQCMEKASESTGHRHFSPFIVAWISSNKSGAKNAPLFKAPGGGYRTANGMRLGYAGAPGKYYANARAYERPKTVPKVKPASKLASRGGFGERNGNWHLSDRNGGSTSHARSMGG